MSEEPAPGSGRRHVASLIGRLAITLAILVWILRSIPVADVFAALGQASLGLLILGLLLEVPIRWLAAIRMQSITRAQQLSIPTWDIFRVAFVSAFYGLFLPGSVSGGAVSWLKLIEIDRQPASVLLSIVFQRSVETFSVIALGLIFWLFDPLAGSHPGMAKWMTAFLAVLVAGYAMALSRPGSRLLGFVAGKLGNGKLAVQAVKTFESLTRFGEMGMRAKVWILLLSALHVGLGSLVAWCLAGAIGLSLSFVSVLWMRSVVYAVTLAPVSFAGFGVREGSLLVMVASYGIEAPEALAWSLLFFAAQLFVALIGAAFEARQFLLPAARTSAKVGGVDFEVASHR